MTEEKNVAAVSALSGSEKSKKVKPEVKQESTEAVSSKVESKPEEGNKQPNQSLGNMTIADLITAITAANQQSKQEDLVSVAKILAQAIIDSKIPYVDPKQVENERKMRESMRKQREKFHADLIASQELCPHLQGSNPLSEMSSQLTSIAPHRLDDGTVIGICTNCLRVFRPGDKDYLTQMRRKSGNKISSAGQRFSLSNRV